MELSDGTIIPSYLGAASPGAEMAFRPQGAEICIGEVKEIIYPKGKKSVSKKFIEYRVIVQRLDAMGRPGVTEFGNCYTSSFFGGVADKCRFTYRKQTKANSSGLGEGSKVVLVCLHGNSNNAIIIGGLRDGQKDETEDPGEDDGHHLVWEFNGMLATIDKDGVFTLTRKGPTDAAGKTDSDKGDTAGAFIKMGADGEIELVDAENANNSIKLNHKDDKVEVKADSGAIHAKAKKKVTVESTSDRILLKSGDGVDIGSDDASEPLVLGNTQRRGIKQLHDSMKSAIQSASKAISQAGTQLNTGAGLILPLTALPAKPSLILAAQALSMASQSLDQIADAISSYEGNADDELSQNHFLNK